MFHPEHFLTLQTIQLHYLDELRYGLPLIPRNVYEISAVSCKLLKFMFIKEEENNEELSAIELPFLKTLHFCEVPRLLSLVRPKKFIDNNDAQQQSRIFFDGKIVLPSLELLVLSQCNDVVELWSKEIYAPGFQNLKEIKIANCEKLSSVGSPSIFSTLVQLETLSITACEKMQEVVSVEETKESKNGEQIIRFPSLKYLKLGDLKKLESFLGGGSKLKFPKLKKLILDLLGSMKGFPTSENTSALFHEKIYFPCMEELQVIRVNDEVMGRLWDKQSLSVSVTSNPAPQLRQLALSNSTDVRQIPSVILENITSLKLAHFQGGDFVFPLSNLGENEGLLRMYSQLPKLEEVKVEESKSLKELFDKKDCNAISDALSSFCRQMKTLELNTLPSLNRIPLELFKSIVSLTLFGLKWDYLISAHFHEDSLRQLQFLSIEYCYSMRALVENVDSQINLYNLKHLRLRYLSSFIGISSTPNKKAALNLPSLEMLEIENLHTPTHFWKGSIDAPNLQEISLSDCYSLKQFLVGNIKDTIELASLKKVTFCSCPCMESFSSGSVRAPKLREVKLQGCHQMKYFFPENQKPKGNLELPSLEIVDIDACYNLSSFSVSPLLAPRLTRITLNKTEYFMQSADKLNGFLSENNVQH